MEMKNAALRKKLVDLRIRITNRLLSLSTSSSSCLPINICYSETKRFCETKHYFEQRHSIEWCGEPATVLWCHDDTMVYRSAITSLVTYHIHQIDRWLRYSAVLYGTFIGILYRDAV